MQPALSAFLKAPPNRSLSSGVPLNWRCRQWRSSIAMGSTAPLGFTPARRQTRYEPISGLRSRLKPWGLALRRLRGRHINTSKNHRACRSSVNRERAIKIFVSSSHSSKCAKQRRRRVQRLTRNCISIRPASSASQVEMKDHWHPHSLTLERMLDARQSNS